MLKLTTLTIPLSNTSTAVKCITALIRNFFLFYCTVSLNIWNLSTFHYFPSPCHYAISKKNFMSKQNKRTAITWCKIKTFSPAHKQCRPRPITGNNHTHMNIEYNNVHGYSTQNCKKWLLCSSCLSVHPHETTWLQLDGFSWNMILEIFKKCCKNSLFIKIWQE